MQNAQEMDINILNCSCNKWLSLRLKITNLRSSVSLEIKYQLRLLALDL